MPTLRVISGGKATEIFHRFKKVTTIGRSEDCDIVLRDLDIEPSHCHIHFDGRVFHLAPIDRDSKIFVNGKRVKKHDLTHQDLVRVGSTDLVFSLYDEPVEEEISQALTLLRNESRCCNEGFSFRH